jgi:hypothetical protein
MEEMPRPAAAPSPSPDDRRTPSPAPPPALAARPAAAPHCDRARATGRGPGRRWHLVLPHLAAAGRSPADARARAGPVRAGQRERAAGHRRDAKAGRPVPGADVRVSMAAEGGGPSVVLYSGKADADGALAASFRVPQGGQTQQTFIVETRSDRGHDEVRQAVTVQRSHKLLLTTDKPVYQPGQVIHLRALAFSHVRYAGRRGQRYRLSRRRTPKATRSSGRRCRPLPLALPRPISPWPNEVIHGDYKLIASLGSTSTEKTVSVKPYVLPKFAVKVTTERSYYLPGERVTGPGAVRLLLWQTHCRGGCRACRLGFSTCSRPRSSASRATPMPAVLTASSSICLPIHAKTQQSSAYDYYNPGQQAIQAPALITVTSAS